MSKCRAAEKGLKFKWLNKQGVESDDGFIVQRVARFEIEYKEGSRVISIYIEPGESAGKPCVIIQHDAFHHWADGTAIPDLKQKEIQKNFTDAMEFQGIAVVVN